jgi:hypothetical protein
LLHTFLATLTASARQHIALEFAEIQQAAAADPFNPDIGQGTILRAVTETYFFEVLDWQDATPPRWVGLFEIETVAAAIV